MFADRLKQLRIENNLTQKELALKIGVNDNTITQYEKGKREPDYSMLSKLADIFSCSADYLLGRTNNKNETLPVTKDKYERVIVYAKDTKVPPEVIENFIEFWKKNNQK